MLMLSGVCRDLLDFGGGHIARIDPTDADAFPMHLEHHLGSALPAQAEELLDHDDHEFHRRVVIVEQHDLVHGRRLQLAALRLQKGVVFVLRHVAVLSALQLPENQTISMCSRSARRHAIAVPPAAYPNLCGGGPQRDDLSADWPIQAFFHGLGAAAALGATALDDTLEGA